MVVRPLHKQRGGCLLMKSKETSTKNEENRRKN